MRWLPLFPALIAALLASCGPSAPVGKGKLISANDPAVQYTGRWDRSDPTAPKASWPGFYLSTAFTGRSISVQMDDPGNYFNVHIDGKFSQVVRGPGKREGVVSLATGLVDGLHTVRLVRRNISFERPTTVVGFYLDKGAHLEKQAVARRRRIEFIGDSYTVAEGNEATEATLAWEKKYAVTDSEKGFATMIARDLEADYMTVCRSGAGVFSDWQGSRGGAMVERYDRTLMDEWSPRWDFSQWTPDLVVISLGLNDRTGLARSDGTIADKDSDSFRREYRRLIDTVRSKYPKVKIVALAPYTPWARENIGQVVRELGSPVVTYAQFDEYPGGYVADGHPTVETHRKMADQILPQLPKIEISKS